MIKNYEDALYRKVLEIKDNLYYQKEIENDLITKVVLSVSGVYHKRDGAPEIKAVRYNLDDDLVLFSDGLEYPLKDIINFRIDLPKTWWCMNILKMIYHLPNSSKIKAKYKDDLNGPETSPMCNLLRDLVERKIIQF